MKRYTVELPDDLAAFLEQEAKAKGVTPEEWLARKAFAAESHHVVSGDWNAAPPDPPPQK